MSALWLALTLAVAAEEVVAPATSFPDEWPTENRRVHAGVGVRLHGGAVDSNGYPLWALQTEVFGALCIRLREHDELRVQLGLSGGWPDSAGGETNVSFHHALSPRLSVGIGGFAYLGLWSMRVGVELPVIIRSSSRRHQLVIGLRVHSGVFNNVPITGWKPSNQRFALAADVAVGYLFQF